MMPIALTASDRHYPAILGERLRGAAPAHIAVLGNLDILDLPKTAFFCSAKPPGHVILAAHDQAARWRDEGRCVVSGFHSPIERECLRILLRGQQPIIIRPARSLDRMRVSAELKPHFTSHALLFLSPFPAHQPRMTLPLAMLRNKLVAALADDAVFARVTDGGQLSELQRIVASWQIPLRHL
jgi:predicted Rossmann fold nucleotide-binding protein DprA/Smf involved in DNA uptake